MKIRTYTKKTIIDFYAKPRKKLDLMEHHCGRSLFRRPCFHLWLLRFFILQPGLSFSSLSNIGLKEEIPMAKENPTLHD
jgi:hypothetical protein